MYRAKDVQSAKEPPKVLKYCSAPSVNLWGGELTEGNKWQVITVQPPIQSGNLTSRTASPRVVEEVGISPPRVEMLPSRVYVEASVTAPPERYTR